MKKLSLSVLSLAALLAVVGCGEKDPSSKSESKSESTSSQTESKSESSVVEATIPTADGKVTIHFELAAESIVPADYASIFMAGAMTGWSTGMDAPVFTKLEGTNKYYTMLDKPEDPSTWLNNGNYDYQLVLGYNETSHMSNLGLQWNDAYKMVQETSGTDNPNFAWDGATNLIDLGKVTFATQVAKPIDPIANVTFSVTLTEALPDGYVVCCPGSWDGWACNKATCTMTPNAERTAWTLAVASMYPGTYEFQLIAEAVDGEGLTWATKSEANNAIGGGNFSCTFTDEDGGATVDILVGDSTTFIFQPAE